jgi:hypothetical protein
MFMEDVTEVLGENCPPGMGELRSDGAISCPSSRLLDFLALPGHKNQLCNAIKDLIKAAF